MLELPKTFRQVTSRVKAQKVAVKTPYVTFLVSAVRQLWPRLLDVSSVWFDQWEVSTMARPDTLAHQRARCQLKVATTGAWSLVPTSR